MKAIVKSRHKPGDKMVYCGSVSAVKKAPPGSRGFRVYNEAANVQAGPVKPAKKIT